MKTKSLPDVFARARWVVLFLALGVGGSGALAAEPAILLANNVFTAGHVLEGGDDLTIAGSTIFYQVDLPPGTQVLEVRVLMQNGDADLYVGPEITLDPIALPFKSVQNGLVTEGGALDDFLLPPLPLLSDHSTWYLAVHGYLETDFEILASWGNAEPANPVENGTPVTAHVGLGVDILVYPGSTLYYTVDIGPDAEFLDVSLTNIQGDADLFVGRILHSSSWAYDAISALVGTADELITLNETTTPRSSDSNVWYIAVHGYEESDFTLTVSWKSTDPGDPTFKRGDVDRTGVVELTDVVNLVGFLYLGAPTALECFDAADVDDTGVVELTDAIVLLGWLYQGSPINLPAPGALACGPDATPTDTLAPCVYTCPP